MATTKLRLDLLQGLVDVEGDVEFVSKVYDDFKERLATTQSGAVRQAPTGNSADTSVHAPASAARKRKRTPSSRTPSSAAGEPAKAKKKPRGSYTTVSDLDLVGSKAGKLKDFYGQFTTNTNFEKNLVFVYFMHQKMELNTITEDHVFTCYRTVGVKVPKALRQSLFDTAERRGWLDTSDMEHIAVTVPGINHLEHDLPRAAAA